MLKYGSCPLVVEDRLVQRTVLFMDHWFLISSIFIDLYRSTVWTQQLSASHFAFQGRKRGKTYLAPHYSCLFVKLPSVKSRVFLWDTAHRNWSEADIHITYLAFQGSPFQFIPIIKFLLFYIIAHPLYFNRPGRSTLNNSYRSSSRSLMKFGSQSFGKTNSLISWEKQTLACGSHAQ